MRRYLLSVLVLVIVIFRDSDNAPVLSGLECIKINDCPVLAALLQMKPVSNETITFIKTSHCGFEGMVEKVWCPKIIDDEVEQTDPEVRSETVTERHQKIISYLGTDSNEIGNGEEHLFPKNCGSILDNKVVGGTDTDIDEYPWVAILQYESRRTKKLYKGCGGILINNRYVLTAAHCVTTISKPVRVVLGEYDTRNETDCVILESGNEDCSPPPIRASIENIDVHPEWLVKGRRPFYNDIALIRLGEKIQFSDFVAPICLPPRNFIVPPNVVVAGWGRTEKGEPAYLKQQVYLPSVDRKECSETLKRDINEGQVCAGGVGGKDACIGDSGGPLMALDQHKGTWTAAGIVSLSLKGCGVEGVPGIYTFVPNYLDWIYSKVKP